MPNVLDPRRWDRRDQIVMAAGIVVGAIAAGALGYFWDPPANSPAFVVKHTVLVFAAVGAVVGLIVTYLQGFTSNEVPPDYNP